MKKVLKVIFTIIVTIFVIYVLYRNINLRTIPSVDLIKDETTSSTYHNILPNTANKSWTNYYYSHDSLESKDIPEDMKYNIAYKDTGTSEKTIKEELIKTSYEKVFGKNTYKATPTFIGGCNTYTYDEAILSYTKTMQQTCPEENIYILSKIVDANLTVSGINITIVIAYIDKTKKEAYKDCNSDMSKCEHVIKKNITDFDEADLDEEKYDLHKYKFTFITENEEYVFDSVKRIK